jgi:hypothetical protein
MKDREELDRIAESVGRDFRSRDCTKQFLSEYDPSDTRLLTESQIERERFRSEDSVKEDLIDDIESAVLGAITDVQSKYSGVYSEEEILEALVEVVRSLGEPS